MNSETHIEAKHSKIHSTGVFAKKDLKKDKRIVQYVGNKLPKVETDAWDENLKDPVYLFELDEHYDIDGDVDWNIAKYLNHSCEPNCESFFEDGEIWIYALKDIAEGEELTYDYNLDIEEEDFKHYACNCEAKNCRGYYIKQNLIPAE